MVTIPPRAPLIVLGTSAACLAILLLLTPLPAVVPALSSNPPTPISSPRENWKNIDLLAQATRPVESNNIVPTYLWHLADDVDHLSEELRRIWIFSAFVDTRPTLAGGPPEIALISSSSRELDVGVDVHYDQSLFCYVVIKKNERSGKELAFKTPSMSTVIPDGHPQSNTLLAAIFTCPIVSDGEVPDWRDSTIFVTLAPEDHPPPHDVFTIATPTPHFDVNAHRQGEGGAAVCIQPLVGDHYASSMRDFIAYYQFLGFTNFYVYLLDPGPNTLTVIRDLVEEEMPGISVVRWTLPIAWLEDEGEYLVNPGEWNIPGIESLTPGEEYNHGVAGSSPAKDFVHIADFGQRAAHSDCTFRSKIDGARWAAIIDWDEYLFLRPPSGTWPPESPSPFATLPSIFHISNFARTIKYETSFPAAMQFRNSFMCIDCQPTEGPTESTSAMDELAMRHWGVSVLHPTPSVPSIFVSSVRRAEWFPTEWRCKSIVDPWAWFDSNIHYPYIPYADYASTRCSDWSNLLGTSLDHLCDFEFLDVWSNKTIVITPPPIAGKSLYQLAPEDELSSSGGMYHLRAVPSVLNALDRWSKIIGEDQGGIDDLADERGTELLNSARAPEELWLQRTKAADHRKKPGPFVEDWNVLLTYGDLLVKILDERRLPQTKSWKQRVKGVRKKVGGVREMLFYLASLGFVIGLLMLAVSAMGKSRDGRPSGYDLVGASKRNSESTAVDM